MRGTLRQQVLEPFRLGIIPAHAGNTHAMLLANLTNRDHPRACGEHPQDNAQRELRAGSSPRMRGTPQIINSGTQKDGIIPAHAGNTQGL